MFINYYHTKQMTKILRNKKEKENNFCSKHYIQYVTCALVVVFKQWCENRTGPADGTGWTATRRHKRVGSTIWTGMMVGPDWTGNNRPRTGKPNQPLDRTDGSQFFLTKNHFEPCKDRTHALSSHSQRLYHPNCEAL